MDTFYQCNLLKLYKMAIKSDISSNCHPKTMSKNGKMCKMHPKTAGKMWEIASKWQEKCGKVLDF